MTMTARVAPPSRQTDPSFQQPWPHQVWLETPAKWKESPSRLSGREQSYPGAQQHVLLTSVSSSWCRSNKTTIMLPSYQSRAHLSIRLLGTEGYRDVGRLLDHTFMVPALAAVQQVFTAEALLSHKPVASLGREPDHLLAHHAPRHLAQPADALPASASRSTADTDPELHALPPAGSYQGFCSLTPRDDGGILGV